MVQKSSNIFQLEGKEAQIEQHIEKTAQLQDVVMQKEESNQKLEGKLWTFTVDLNFKYFNSF